MKVTILGCGAAGGVPMISAGWGQCDPIEPKNRRLRPSILLQEGDFTVLVDTGPDLRQQLLSANVRHLDGVLYTHGHADHTHGIDDLREVNRIMRAAIPAYGSKDCLEDIAQRFSYVFDPLDLETVPVYKPWLVPTPVEDRFELGPWRVEAIDQDHGYGRTLGFRIGNFAYCTDVWEFPENSLKRLENLDVWIIGCLIDQPHPTHAHVDKILAWAEIIKPKHTIFTHMSPRLDYNALKARLPAGMEPAYDGMVIEL
jgi:phosphoribosyl 1,2-cyclic phosphate phosphodiesterase